MEALVLEEPRRLGIRDIQIDEPLGPRDVRIRVTHVGICGSDLHYYTDGRVGPFVVTAPLVLGHEASGVVIERGGEVDALAVGDAVCMEPGVPDLASRASREGKYNLDPSVVFWATPPVHGALRESVVHPAAFTYRLPESVSLAEGALVEPLAVGMHAAVKARMKPGDVAVVLGAGTIGLVTALSALAGGASRVIITDVVDSRLELARSLGAVTAVNVARESLADAVSALTGGWGADVVFEASGDAGAVESVIEPLAPGGTVVLVGMPNERVSFDVVAMQAKEPRIETVFRYANVFGRALDLMASGQVDLKRLITDTFPFERGAEAFLFAARRPPGSVKVQIAM